MQGCPAGYVGQNVGFVGHDCSAQGWDSAAQERTVVTSKLDPAIFEQFGVETLLDYSDSIGGGHRLASSYQVGQGLLLQ